VIANKIYKQLEAITQQSLKHLYCRLLPYL